MTALQPPSCRAKSGGAGTTSSRELLGSARDERFRYAAPIWLALTAAAAPQTAVQAERAFAADAQTLGQWTAFRKWAAPGAILFTPQPMDVQKALEGAPDPELTYQWWPAEAFVSCDKTTAVTTGPSVRGPYRGYFTTVWRRQPDGSWKWLLDHGDGLGRPRPAGADAVVRRASCRPAPALRQEGQRGYEQGLSPDKSLIWRWRVYENGARIVWAELWDGSRYQRVIEDKVDGSAR